MKQKKSSRSVVLEDDGLRLDFEDRIVEYRYAMEPDVRRMSSTNLRRGFSWQASSFKGLI